jgi:hypothetical protein
MLLLSFSWPIRLAASACLAASVILFAAPLFWPEFPIGPLILANWVAFIVAGYLILQETRGETEITKHVLNLWKVLLASSAIAGLLAWIIAERII